MCDLKLLVAKSKYFNHFEAPPYAIFSSFSSQRLQLIAYVPEQLKLANCHCIMGNMTEWLHIMQYFISILTLPVFPLIITDRLFILLMSSPSEKVNP